MRSARRGLLQSRIDADSGDGEEETTKIDWTVSQGSLACL